jgi:hypothetical protein
MAAPRRWGLKAWYNREIPVEFSGAPKCWDASLFGQQLRCHPIGLVRSLNFSFRQMDIFQHLRA